MAATGLEHAEVADDDLTTVMPVLLLLRLLLLVEPDLVMRRSAARRYLKMFQSLKRCFNIRSLESLSD